MKRLIFLTIALVLFFTAHLSAKDVSLESLLKEMTDRAAIAEFPDPYYTCKQASSYDRASVAPDKPGWFANGDASQFVRDEMNGDRKEWVLMDADGPGAIVRWWITAPHYKVTFRIYIDGADKPEIEANIGELIGGEFLVGAPLSEETARGRNLYLPIPFGKHIKVTVDDMPTQQNLYYQINYRTYEPGTNVESFSMAGFKRLAELVEKTQKDLVWLEYYDEKMVEMRTLKAGQSQIVGSRNQQGAIVGLDVFMNADDLPQALRSTLLCISFDGKETVRCPVGDFFGSGVGVNCYKSWYTSVFNGPQMKSNFVMPFRSNAQISLVNLSTQDIEYSVWTTINPYDWTPNTMYFHCNWRQDREIVTKAGDGTMDWNYIDIKGKGVFVGDSLSVVNRHNGWWGEGDEKIYVDGETFPSHFGTGTEDYYGYAWCTPQFFESPFHAQPRAEGPGNYGNTTNSRYRLLDGIPFTTDFRFDMEVWHWIATKIDYSVATYWYAVGDATTNQPDNLVEEAKAKVSYKTTEFVVELPGYDLVNQPNGQLSIQNMTNWRGSKWHNDKQLWWTGARPGDELKIKIQVENSGRQKFVVGMTKAVDYGQVQFSIDGKDIGGIVDLYHDGVIHSGMVTIGTVDLPAGEHVLGVKITGKNAQSTSFMFGMDKFEFRPLD
ncbi:MAG: DUF2961 domain-containing protein [Planctomycetaceae bacterium]|nr:DUF2961 domain-containing protein [Planctomycetaceae bacterium]